VKTTAIWTPQVGPQTAIVNCPVIDVLAGGARGGGKSDVLLGDIAIKANLYGSKFRALFLRRTLTEMAEIHRRAQELYPKLGATWMESKETWTFPNGATCRMTYIEDDRDAERYMGASVTYIAIDEAGNFPSPAPLDKLFGALRSPEGIPVYRRMTCNPGGVGHSWIYDRYIRHGAWNIRNWQPQPKLAPNVWVSSVFIPAKLEDNKILMENDPMYDARLAMVGDETLYRAWREGDWTVLAGVYFSNFDERNHFDCPEIKPWWPRYLAGDWGFSSWSAFHWGAWDGERLWVYREMSVRGMDPQALGERLVEVNNGDKIERFFFSHDAFSKRTSERSMAQEIADVFIRREASIPMPEPADFNRVAGWQLVFQGFRTKSLIISPTNCMRLMATIPMLVRDPKRPEDVLKGNDDHWADSLRYLCASRLRADVTVPRDILQANFVDEVEDMNVKAMRARLIAAKGDDLAPVRLAGRFHGYR